MIKKFILIFTTVVVLKLFGQSEQAFVNNIDNLPKEYIYLHSNTNFLLTGETLYYTVTCKEQEDIFSSYSTVAYIELIDKSNTSIARQKIALNNGYGYGDFFIHSKIKSGTYKIIAYTQWMKNLKTFYEKELCIINPFTSKIKEASIEKTLVNQEKTSSNAFHNLKSTYNKRERIAINLKDKSITNPKQISISIRKLNNFNLPIQKGSLNSKGKSYNFYLPELRGSLIQGKLTSENNVSLSNIQVSLSTGDKNRLPINAITNDEGKFFFNVPNLTMKNVHIQVLDENKNDYKIELMPHVGIEESFNDFSEITIDKIMTEEIQKRNIYAQIENSYSSIKKNTILNINTEEKLFEQIKEVYMLDDYKRFKTIKETFVEIIPLTNFNLKNNKQKLYVISDNESKVFRHVPALLIVDGRIVYDHNDLLAYDSRKVKSISIVRNEYYYGNYRYKGVVLVDTFKNDFFNDIRSTTSSYHVLPTQPYKEYFFQNQKNSQNSRVPDYRTQLYWNPSLNTSDKEIVFYSSDITGEFQIEIKGFTTTGTPISIKDYFTVKE